MLAIAFIFERKLQHRLLFAALIFLLKPHLAVALLFGTVSVILFKQIRSKFDHVTGLLFILFSYILGSLSFSVGSYFRDGFFPGFPVGFLSQDSLSQISLNFFGLQFFSLLNDQNSIVPTPIHILLLSRLVLLDTWLIPISFMFIVAVGIRRLQRESVLILMSFVFYLGLVSQTDWNSTRQNIPFLAAMGIVSAINIDATLDFRRNKLYR